MKHTINGHITYFKSEYIKEPVIGFTELDPSSFASTQILMVSPYSFEVEIPDDFDYKKIQTQSILEERERAIKAHQKRLKNFDELLKDFDKKLQESTTPTT